MIPDLCRRFPRPLGDVLRMIGQTVRSIDYDLVEVCLLNDFLQ